MDQPDVDQPDVDQPGVGDQSAWGVQKVSGQLLEAQHRGVRWALRILVVPPGIPDQGRSAGAGWNTAWVDSDRAWRALQERLHFGWILQHEVLLPWNRHWLSW